MKLRNFAIALLSFASFTAVAQEAKNSKPEQSKPEGAKSSIGDAKPAGGSIKSTSGKTAAVTADSAKSIHEFVMKDIDGNDVPLSKYKGKPMLVVNVASMCGFTPQYEQLQKLHTTYGAKGLAVVGFPANNFKNQEPNSNAEIKKFCSDKFNVTFDMFSKVSVKGDDACEMYKWLTDKHGGSNKFAGEIKWNFTKFLLDGEGNVIARFEPNVKPDDKVVIEAIEKALSPEPKSLR